MFYTENYIFLFASMLVTKYKLKKNKKLSRSLNNMQIILAICFHQQFWKFEFLLPGKFSINHCSFRSKFNNTFIPHTWQVITLFNNFGCHAAFKQVLPTFSGFCHITTQNCDVQNWTNKGNFEYFIWDEFFNVITITMWQSGLRHNLSY